VDIIFIFFIKQLALYLFTCPGYLNDLMMAGSVSRNIPPSVCKVTVSELRSWRQSVCRSAGIEIILDRYKLKEFMYKPNIGRS
jgi:hypothetical protein